MGTFAQSPATARSGPQEPRKSPRWTRGRITYMLVLPALLTVAVLALRLGGDAHLRAMSILLRFTGAQPQSVAASFANHPVREEVGEAQTSQGSLKYRLYVPEGLHYAGGVVLLHGVHHLGMEDSRLKNLSRALAGAGIEVMTPELQDLADYRVTARSVDEIGESAVILSTKMNLPSVGVIGLSFAGGLALLAAARTEYATRMGFVMAVGAHDDMNRVARFFAGNMIEKPDGSAVPFQAHEYGVLVLAYSHLEDFFLPQDLPAAREALRRWLWEQPDALQAAEALSPAGRKELDLLLHHRDQLQPALFHEIQRHAGEMQAVSPHGQVGELRVPVYLLHGAGDTIIPSSETLWLAKDVPQQELRSVLVSPALIHVDMGDSVKVTDKWLLVDFLAQVVKASDQLGKKTLSRDPGPSSK